jgi:hypothetical protein
MKRTNMNQEAYKINNENLRDVNYCEAALPGCTGFCKRTIAHRHKRRHYRTVEELTDPKEVAVVGFYCHELMERDSKLTEQVFRRIRG